jgi:hypothetical protein
MGPSRTDRPCRRRFLQSAGLVAAGAAGGYAAAYLNAWRSLGHDTPRLFAPSQVSRSKFAMPGPYPGRVVEVHHPQSVSDDHVIDGNAVRSMIDRGMCELTGSDEPLAAWKRFFEKGDVVGIKVNPVGKAMASRAKGAAGSISQPEVVIEIVRNLKEVGIAPRDIIVFERYADEFVNAGYEALMRTRPLDGVRWMASSAEYSNDQVALDGVDNGGRANYSPELLKHVAGYDPDCYAEMGFSAPDHDKKDDRRFRSHLSLIVTRMVNKIITIPVLKDHRSAGVTLALKNMSHGMNNNVARSHVSGIVHGFPYAKFREVVNPNQCNTFIPTAASHAPLREKATLHILDGLIGCYEGGPGNWNRTWATWRRKSLFFATDPVAMDHVGWDVIDAVRAENGWPRSGEMGRGTIPPEKKQAAQLAPLAALSDPLATVAFAASGAHVLGGAASDQFERRQPDHIPLAGSIGLGTFDSKDIRYSRVKIG